MVITCLDKCKGISVIKDHCGSLNLNEVNGSPKPKLYDLPDNRFVWKWIG